MITITTRRQNIQRKLMAAPIFVEAPCVEVDGRYAGALPNDWNVEKAAKAAEIANRVRDEDLIDDIPNLCDRDENMIFMVYQLLQA